MDKNESDDNTWYYLDSDDDDTDEDSHKEPEIYRDMFVINL